MSRRSEPSAAKRIVTTPPASTAVTIPSPSDPWRTSSPVERVGTFVRGSIPRAPRRNPVDEARREVLPPPPPQRAGKSVREGQPLHRARHPDVAEPALFFDALLLDRA